MHQLRCRNRCPVLGNVQDVPQQQQTIVDTVTLLHVQLHVGLHDVLDVIRYGFGAPSVSESLLAGGQQLIQLEDGVPPHVGLGDHLRGHQVLDGYCQVHQDLDGGVYYLRRLSVGVIFDVYEERKEVLPDVLPESDGTPKRPQARILQRQVL